MAWPHEHTNWAPYLAEARAAVAAIAAQISRFERLLMVARDTSPLELALRSAGAMWERVACFTADSNDIWARDFGPITVREDDQPVLLDFRFNGWGRKHRAERDDQITHRLTALGAFGRTAVRTQSLILEGGSIETDGQGTLLTTTSCLLNPNRNPTLDQRALEAELHRHLGVQRVLWLSAGPLAGDDTDGHIDTLARFAPNDTLLYVRCPDPADEHHVPLAALEAQLRTLRTTGGRGYRLMPLPWPRARYEGSQRLPATYANFLVLNRAVLVPAYGDPADAAAREVVGRAFPGREIVSVDCACVIRQRGAVHCLTMQLPQGVLA